jgi:hypothetical protein
MRYLNSKGKLNKIVKFIFSFFFMYSLKYVADTPSPKSAVCLYVLEIAAE